MLSAIARDNHEELHELRALFEKQLRELYWAERTMLTVLSAVIAETFSKDLVAALEKHRAESISHGNRLEKIFRITGIEPQEEKYEAVACLVNELEGYIASTKRGVVRDAGVISVLQKMEHYEIACYGTMRAYAIALREEEAIAMLEDTLAEEKEADLALSRVAESHINIEAADKEV